MLSELPSLQERLAHAAARYALRETSHRQREVQLEWELE